MEKLVKLQTISYKTGTGYVGKLVPYIRIANTILEKYGFKYRDKIVIVYQKEKLIVFTLKEYQKQKNINY